MYGWTTTQVKVKTCCPMGHSYEKHSRLNSRGRRECVTCRKRWAAQRNAKKSEDRRLARERRLACGAGL